MKNYKLDNTIPFQKRENSDNKKKEKRIIQKSEKIVSLSKYKQNKIKKNCLKVTDKINKDKIKKNFFPIIIIAAILIIILSTIFGPKLYGENNAQGLNSDENVLTVVEAPIYKSIISKTVAKHTENKYDVYVSELHKNGKYIYAQGYLDVPNRGKVFYDMILDDTDPISLKINGMEFLK